MAVQAGLVRLGAEPTLVLHGTTYRLTAVQGVADRCLAGTAADVDQACAQVRSETEGAEAVLYHVASASPRTCSPMEYGGKYLEADRTLLSELAVPSVLLVSSEGAYLDVLAAMPCTVIAWRQSENPTEPAALGAVCLTASDSPAADLQFEVQA